MSYNRNFVAKDYESFRQFMIDLIPEYTENWTDTSQSDFGITLIELYARSLDVLSYYQDVAVRENILPTAQRKDSIQYLAEFLGYPISGKVPAKVSVTFTKYDDLIDEEIEIPLRTRVSIDDKSIIYETLEKNVIPAGELSADVVMTQGETVQDDYIGRSDGTKAQSFKLTYPNSLKSTLDVRTLDREGAPIDWTQKETFVDAETDERVFVVKQDNDFHVVNFSDGMSGKIPENDYRIVADYRTCLGEEGNVGVNTLTKLLTSVEGVEAVTNPSVPFIEGKDEEKKELVKNRAPRNWRTNDRVVTAGDFEDYAIVNVDEVINAKTEETFNADNDVILHIADESYNITLSAELIAEIEDTIAPYMVLNNNLIVQACNYVNWSIEGTLEIKDNYLNSEVTQNVVDTLSGQFSVQNFTFGDKAKILDIMHAVKEVDGVDNFSLSLPTSDVSTGEYEIALLTQITLDGEVYSL